KPLEICGQGDLLAMPGSDRYLHPQLPGDWSRRRRGWDRRPGSDHQVLPLLRARASLGIQTTERGLRMKSPLVVAYGVGVDSTGLLVGLKARGIRPDLILTSDTGDEKPETYAYLPIIGAWLEKAGFPPITIVKNPRRKSGDKSLSE